MIPNIAISFSWFIRSLGNALMFWENLTLPVCGVKNWVLCYHFQVMHLISNILLDKVTKTVNEQLTFCKLKIVFNELCTQELILLNPFVPDALFFQPLKTSENLAVFWCFQGVEKGCIGNEWVKRCFTVKPYVQILFTNMHAEAVHFPI